MPQQSDGAVRGMARRVLMLSIPLWLTGCGGKGLIAQGVAMLRPPRELERLSLVATEDANDRVPIPVDLVQVRDPEVAATLGEMSAAQWFASRSQLRQQYLGRIEIHSWEIVPGLRVDAAISNEAFAAARTLLFMLYGNGIKGVASLDDAARVNVLLAGDDFSILKK